VTTLWLLPLAVTLSGLMAVFVAGSRAANEAELLAGELRAMAGLRLVLADLQASTRTLGGTRGEARRSKGG